MVDSIENEALVEAIQAGASDRLAELYNNNQRLLHKVCKRFEGRAELDDLMQESYLALREAAYDYDPVKGVPFSHYAAKRIEWHLVGYSASDTLIRTTAAAREGLRKRKKLTGILEVNGITLSDRGVELATGVKATNSIKAAMAAGQRIRSLWEPLTGADSINLCIAETLADSSDRIGAVEDRIDAERIKDELWRKIDKTLSKRQSEVIHRHYQRGERFTEIGADASREHAKALQNLRRIKFQFADCYEWIFGKAIKRTGSRAFNESWTSATEYTAIRLYELGQSEL